MDECKACLMEGKTIVGVAAGKEPAPELCTTCAEKLGKRIYQIKKRRQKKGK